MNNTLLFLYLIYRRGIYPRDPVFLSEPYGLVRIAPNQENNFFNFRYVFALYLNRETSETC